LFQLIDEDIGLFEPRWAELSATALLLSALTEPRRLMTTILLSRVLSVDSTAHPARSDLYGLKLNSLVHSWQLFFQSHDRQEEWRRALAESRSKGVQIPAEVKPLKPAAAIASSAERSFLYPSGSSDSQSVFALEEDAVPEAKFSPIDDDDEPVVDDAPIAASPMLRVLEDYVDSPSPPTASKQATAAGALRQSGSNMATPVPSGKSKAATVAPVAVASSLPIAITSRLREWRPTVRDTEYPPEEEEDRAAEFEKPHERAAQTYKEYYLKTGLQLDIPDSASTVKVRF